MTMCRALPKAFILVSYSIAMLSHIAGVKSCHAQNSAHQRAYLRGLGWYNYNTARAEAIHAESVIRWKADLRRIQCERREWIEQIERNKKLSADERKRLIAHRERELRLSPTAEDVIKGDALNALQFDLTDPTIDPQKWAAHPVQLPEGLSVKDLVFQFLPTPSSNPSTVALSRGVIALSRLDLQKKCPTVLALRMLDPQRREYEYAYKMLSNEIIGGQFKLDSLLALDKTLKNLRDAINESVPTERGFRTEALLYMNNLEAATRMFDASTVDYAREIIVDTQEHDATTVEELLAFMLKYRLKFGSAEKDPAARELFQKVYQSMREQAGKLEIRYSDPRSVEVPSGTWQPLFNGRDLSGWSVDRGDANQWRFANRSIVARSDSWKTRNWLLSEKEYSDFVLRFEFQAGTDISNGAVAIRAAAGEKVPHSDRDQIFDYPLIKLTAPNLPSGLVTGTTEWLRSAEKRIAPDAVPKISVGRWHKCEVVVQGDSCTVSVDGERCVDLKLEINGKAPFNFVPGLKRKQGKIGFQIHTGTMMYRNIEILDLSK